jgi:hypothetical protein
MAGGMVKSRDTLTCEADAEGGSEFWPCLDHGVPGSLRGDEDPLCHLKCAVAWSDSGTGCDSSASYSSHGLRRHCESAFTSFAFPSEIIAQQPDSSSPEVVGSE